jgi:nucleotide-binding universal stress UspA family protein
LQKKNGLKNIEPPKIFTLILSSQKEAVEVLTTHAKKEKADFIVVSSHAKKGLKRLIIGSFAETLTNYAKYPVAVITPNMQIKNDFSSIVLPTTFTKNEKKVFLWAIQFAKNFKSKIIITHSLPYPQDPILSSGMFLLGSAPSVPIVNLTDYEKSKKEIEKKAKDLEKLAKLHQIKTETIINDMCITISDGIIKTSKKQKASLIIMAHQSSRLATTLLGSITRQIIRESSTPVLIYKT